MGKRGMDRPHVETDMKFYTTWTSVTTICALLVLLFVRGQSSGITIARCVCRAFLLNAITVGLMGAFVLAYKKGGISPDKVELKFRSNFWQHALPSFVATCVLFHSDKETDWKYLLYVVGMQFLYFCVPYNGKIGFSKFDAVYDSTSNPLLFLATTNVVLFGTAFVMKFRFR